MATQSYTPLSQGQAPAMGTSGDAVKTLQTSLNTQNAGKAGYTPLVVDGKYGALTQAAVNYKAPTSTPATGSGAGTGTTPPTNPASVTDPNSAHSFINGNQEKDFNTATTANSTDTPPVKGDANGNPTPTPTDALASLKAEVTPSTPKPTAPNLTDTYKNLLQTSGINDLESQLSNLKQQASSITATYSNLKLDEEGKPVPMNVINGRMSEEDRQATEKLNPINEQIKAITDQLTTKYSVVNNIMTFTGKDYDNAVQDYDKQFSDNIAMINAVKTLSTTDNTAVDNARANLQIIYNGLSNGTATVDSLTPDQKANITKLETQAGLPVGFYNSIVAKNNGGSILSTTTRDDNGTKYADVILKNSDGSLSIKSYALGGTSTGNGTAGDQKNSAYTNINSILDNPKATTKDGAPVVDSNGKITPSGFNQIVKYGSTLGLNIDDILAQYGRQLYAGENNDYAGYGLNQSQILKLTT
jgi:hypothetical protein